MANEQFSVMIFVTGMHLDKKYGYTVNEILKAGFTNIYTFVNDEPNFTMDMRLAKTIIGLSDFTKRNNIDLIIVHGDRIEALAGAIVGSLTNTLVAHIEGGEVSGTVDEIIRHAVTKMSHIHFVANGQAKKRLRQMGEDDKNIYTIGSPDIDIMFSNTLPCLEEALNYYDIPFSDFGIVLFHPVTTELDQFQNYTKIFVDVLLKDLSNYIVIFPNNDPGTDIIINEFTRFKELTRFRVFPSIRFEYFLTFLKNCEFIIGNSSAGIREAPSYGIPSINIGTRQNNRALSSSVINANYDSIQIFQAIELARSREVAKRATDFGGGDSNKKFIKTIISEKFWQTPKQKYFIENK